MICSITKLLFRISCLLKQSHCNRHLKALLLSSSLTCKCADKISPPLSLHLDSELLSAPKVTATLEGILSVFSYPREGRIFCGTLIKHSFPNRELQRTIARAIGATLRKGAHFCHVRLIHCSPSKGSKVFSYLTVAARKVKQEK